MSQFSFNNVQCSFHSEVMVDLPWCEGSHVCVVVST